MQNQKSALGMDGNVTALIGYLVGIVALILIFMEQDNKFVRFHALQSVFWSVVCTIGLIAFLIVGFILGLVFSQISSGLATVFGLLMILLYIGVCIALFAGLVYSAVKAYGGAMFKLPIVGNLAEKYV